MSDYPLSPLGASCSSTISRWCPTHGCPLVEVDPNVWDCPIGVLDVLMADLRRVWRAYVGDDDMGAESAHARATRIIDASPSWPVEMREVSEA